MNQEKTEVSRRRFLAAGSAVAAAALLAQRTNAAAAVPETNSKEYSPTSPLPSDDPVTTEAAQTLKNKRISALDGNILGTDYINIREAPSFPATGIDITAAINWAIDKLSTAGSLGGQILIPRGVWESDGGHQLKQGISIEGTGFSPNTGHGTEIYLKSGTSQPSMFAITGSKVKCSLKNLMINLYNKPSGIGLLIRNSGLESVNGVHLEDICFASGRFGIKVEATNPASYQFENILNHYERVTFLLCQTGFSCNTINGGYDFDNCYFVVPTTASSSDASAKTALYLETMGNISLNHCLFVGNYPSAPGVPPTDGTTILKTVGAFNSISFIDCQDENLEYAYQNGSNYYPEVPLVYRNCLLQSKLKFTATGSVVFDSCRLNGTLLSDTSTASVRVLRQGLTDVFNTTPANKIANFVNKVSYIIDEFGNLFSPAATNPAVQEVNASYGNVTIASGTSSVVVYNKFVRDFSLIFTQLRTYDSGGAQVSLVQSANEYFVIYLTKNATTDLTVAFKVNIV